MNPGFDHGRVKPLFGEIQRRLSRYKISSKSIATKETVRAPNPLQRISSNSYFQCVTDLQRLVQMQL